MTMGYIRQQLKILSSKLKCKKKLGKHQDLSKFDKSQTVMARSQSSCCCSNEEEVRL